MGQIPVQVQSQVFSNHSNVMLSSFIKTWYLGERRLFAKVLLGVTSKALPALEANAGLTNEFEWVQHPEGHLGPTSVTLHLDSPHTHESRRRHFRSPPSQPVPPTLASW